MNIMRHHAKGRPYPWLQQREVEQQIFEEEGRPQERPCLISVYIYIYIYIYIYALRDPEGRPGLAGDLDMRLRPLM